MTETFKVACIQTNSGNEISASVKAADELVRAARSSGAELIVLPENVSMIEPDYRLLREKVRFQDDDPALKTFRQLADETKVWLVVGSLPIKLDENKIANRSFVIDHDGAIVSQYDKIHLFDVDLGNGETYRESDEREAGDKAVIADIPWGKLGMSICYDLRFPHLYRYMSKNGASFLSVPAAFTRSTGMAHWHVLLRARAIENGCYVFAPAQCGEHAGGRRTFGHSLIVDPWGEVIADAGTDTGFIVADIDLAKVAEARRKIPSLSHDRPFDLD